MADDIITMLDRLPHPSRRIPLGAGHGIVIAHPSGRDWIVASIVEAPHGPIVQIAEFADRADGMWVDVRDAFSALAATRAIFEIAALGDARG